MIIVDINLFVSVPPDILDYPTSSDQVAREGANVTLRCAAHGVPTPTVVWRREAGDLLPTTNFSDTQSKINFELHYDLDTSFRDTFFLWYMQFLRESVL